MAAKIKDGLFIGDAESAGDAEFLDLNKIVNLGNLAAREVPNRFSAHGLVYLSLNWQDHNDFVLFDAQLTAVIDIVCFVDESLKHGQSVLLFSTRGVGRCAVAACVYLMYKYRWGFEKAYDYIVSKKPDIDINRGFVHQLFLLDKKLAQLRKSLPVGSYTLPASSALGRSPNAPLPVFAPVSASPEVEKARREDWDSFYLEREAAAMDKAPPRVAEEVGDELLLVYSYLNSKNTITAVPGPYPDALRQSKSFAIRFNPDLYLNHQYEEPGGHLVIATKTSSGKPHPPLPPSPGDPKHGSSHGPGHSSGILKGGKHYSVYRRKQNKTANSYAPAPDYAPPHVEVGFESTRSIGFDSPPRAASSLGGGGWASPEQRLHDILDDLSNHNADPVPAPQDGGRSARPKGRPAAGKSGSAHRHSRSGELTDTSDEDEGGPPFVSASAGLAPVKDTPTSGFAADSKVAAPDRHRDAKPTPVRAESKSTSSATPAGFKESPGIQPIYRPSGDSKAAQPPPSLYDLANMQVAPAYQQSARGAVLGAGDADFEVDEEVLGASKVPASRYTSERKSVPPPQSAGRPGAKPAPSAPASEAKHRNGGSGIRAYGERLDLLEADSELGQHSMLTGGGTIVIEDDEDDMYVSSSSVRPRKEEEYKQADAVTQSLLRAKHLAEDAMGRASNSYQAQQDRQSQMVQQQDRARQREGSVASYGSQPTRQEAWSAGARETSYPPAPAPSRAAADSRSRESVAAAAVAAAEAMASYRSGPGSRQPGRAAPSMPRFDNGTAGSGSGSRGLNRTDSSERRPSVDRRANERPEPKSKPEWVGTSGSTDTVGSGRDSVGSGRTPKVYRHGSPAPRTAPSSSRLSQTSAGSTSSLRRDSLGRDSLGSTGGDSLGTQRSRESGSSYRRPSPSPYEQRQGSRPSQSTRPSSAGTSRPVSRSSTPTRADRPDSGGGSGSRASTPTRGWRF